MRRICAQIIMALVISGGVCLAQHAAPDPAVDPLTGRLFEQVQPKLGEALDLYDRH